MLTHSASSLSRVACVATTLALFIGAGCAGGANKKHVMVPSSEALPNETSETTLTSAEAPSRISPTISVSVDIARACKLQLHDMASTPKFDFDKSDLLPEDIAALDKIADCLSIGPLKGHTVKLIGRADPRGTTEYNMALGAMRAGSVGAYLAKLGVAMNRLDITSRGELDAVGIDEMGWQIDRRVDIVLGE